MTMPTAGTKAPAISLPDETGQIRTLEDFKGQKVVVYFYPKDDTPGCTQEACDFRDNINRLVAQGCVVLGISKDSSASHKKFKEKYDLTFPLLSDKDGDVCERYGVWGEKKFMGKTYMGITRATFLIGPDGIITHTWPKVSVKGHVDEVIAAAL